MLGLLGERLRSLPVKTLRKVVCVTLVLWLIASLLQLIWVFIPDSQSDQSQVPVSNGQNKQHRASVVDIDKLKSLSLFGVAGEQVPAVTAPAPIADEVEINATKTRLNLTLEGIVYTPDTASSLAVIVYQGKQDQYYIGDKLPVGSRVELAKVLIDHVILDNAGNYESLWLYDDEKAKRSQPIARRTPVNTTSPNVTDIRSNQQATNLAQDYRNRLYKNPSSLAEVLRISPSQKDGELVGYRVSPGKDRRQFAQLGFESNDVVTSINGITLDEPSKALEIYKLMRTATEATFSVDRNGEPVEVLVSLDGDNAPEYDGVDD